MGRLIESPNALLGDGDDLDNLIGVLEQTYADSDEDETAEISDLTLSLLYHGRGKVRQISYAE